MQLIIEVKVDTKKLDYMIAKMDGETTKIVKQFGIWGADMAKGFAPVDTGALINSIETHMEGAFTAIIEPHVHYAIYQELGFHHWISGKFIQNPFLTPMVESLAGEFLSPQTWAPLITV